MFLFFFLLGGILSNLAPFVQANYGLATKLPSPLGQFTFQAKITIKNDQNILKIGNNAELTFHTSWLLLV